MKELFTRLENTNLEITNNIEQLGWFLYEISDKDGDHSEAINTLLQLNPTFVSERENLVQNVFEILQIDPAMSDPAETQEDINEVGQEPVSETVSEPMQHDDGEIHEEVEFQFPKDGVIKIFNEPNFKLAVCSADVSEKFLNYAKERKCPVELLDPITQENLLEIEKQCRQRQAFWS